MSFSLRRMSFAAAMTFTLLQFSSQALIAQQSSAEYSHGKAIDAEGVLEVNVEETPTESRTYYALQTATERIALHFTDRPKKNLVTGMHVKAHGVAVGHDLTLSTAMLTTSGTGSSTSATTSVAPLTNTTGAQKTLVILINFQDLQTQPYTKAIASDVVFNQSSNFFLENSFQQTWLQGDVAGWFTIPMNGMSVTCDSTFVYNIAAKAKSAATSAGYNIAAYSHFVYAFPQTSSCSWWGTSNIGGNPSSTWINGSMQLKVAAHELGHALGLYHSHALNCGTLTLCNGGTVVEYGDVIDMMGNPKSGHYSAYQKERLGWLNAAAMPTITTVSSSGSYPIEAYESLSFGPKALKILQNASSGAYYYIEFRQPLGFDSFVSSYPDILSGVVVHLVNPSDPNSLDLLNMSPATSMSDPALPVGTAYFDSSANVSITVSSASPSGATVQVNFGATQSCSTIPSVSASTSGTAVPAGTTVSYTITASNNDPSSCSPSSISISAMAPSGWLASLAPAVSNLAPGTSATATLTLTSSNQAASGTYNIPIVVTDGSVNNSTSVSYTVSAPTAPLSVSTSTDRSTYSAQQNVSINSHVTSGITPTPGATMSMTILKPDGKSSSASATSDGTGSATFSYKVSRKDPKGTYVVRVTATFSGQSASSSTTFLVQ